jgi:hypothetical protein
VKDLCLATLSALPGCYPTARNATSSLKFCKFLCESYRDKYPYLLSRFQRMLGREEWPRHVFACTIKASLTTSSAAPLIGKARLHMNRTEIVRAPRSPISTQIGLSILFVALTCSALTSIAVAQSADKQSGTAVCTLDDGKQISARYTPVPTTHAGLPQDKVWAPGGSALTLFTESTLMLGNTPIGVGAYTMYLVPGKKDWILIVSKNVNVDQAYDQQQDLARATMSVGTLMGQVPELRVTFGHTGPKKCELNVDFGKTKAWVEFSAI